MAKSASSSAQPPEHTIIGGGIIGLTLASQLSDAGYRVTVLDRTAPGDQSQASYGNAGMLSFASYRPVAEPGIWKDGIKALLDPDSVLRIAPGYTGTIAPWLWRFLKESQSERAQANADATLALNAHSHQCWHSLISRHRLKNWIAATGWLKVFRTEKAFSATLKQRPAVESAGLGLQTFNSDELHELEPALSPDVRFGMLQTDSLFVRQPHHLLTQLAGLLAEQGVRFERVNVAGLQKTDTGFQLQTNAGTRQAKRLSLCAGAWSQRLLATLGERVPLETERGYHLMFPATEQLGRPVMHVEDQFVVSPMSEGLRMTTGEELAGLDAPPDYRLINRKQQALRRLLPDADLTVERRWLGFRPSLPDSKPIISRHPYFPELTMAFGHGHLGMTQSAATGHLLSQLITGENPAIDLNPYRFGRFTG